MINWYFGWCLILAAFLSGAVLGLFFHRPDFLGGYESFRRRVLRLGHVALVGLGMINVLYGMTPLATEPSWRIKVGSVGFLVGGVTMPLVCFLTSWRAGFRHLFFIPVSALVIAVVQTLRIGLP